MTPHEEANRRLGEANRKYTSLNDDLYILQQMVRRMEEAVKQAMKEQQEAYACREALKASQQTHVPVHKLIELKQAGWSDKKILNWYTRLTQADLDVAWARERRFAEAVERMRVEAESEIS